MYARTLALASIVILLIIAACSGPEGAAIQLPGTSETSSEETTNEVAVDAESAEVELADEAAAEPSGEEAVGELEKAMTVGEALEAAAEAAETEKLDAELVEVEPEVAPAEVNWLTVSTRAEYDLAAIGNPDAPLVITEFSDFM
ncbi:MAG: hypothetical protein AAF702_19375 [Chloroflexota bacterium]